MEALQLLSRNEMKGIMAGQKSNDCSPSCMGCITNGSYGPPACYKWTCQGGMCAPVADTCCIV